MKKTKKYLTIIIFILLSILILSILYYMNSNNNIKIDSNKGLFLEKVGINFNSLPQDDE